MHQNLNNHQGRFQDSVVNIPTRYRLDGLGSNLGGGVRFSAPVQTGIGADTMGTGFILGEKRTGRGVDHPPPSSAEVKERVEL